MAFHAVQFWGIESVLEAYKMRAVPAWSVWCGKLLNYSYEGDDLETGYAALEGYLKLMGRATNAVYTLKIHRELKTDELINEKTVCNGAFNFKLNGEDQAITVNQYGAFMQNKELDARLQKIEKLLEGEEVEEEETDDTIGKVQRLIESPVISGILGKWFNMDLSSASRPGTIGGVHSDAEMNKALTILKKHDPKLSFHLMQLARIAESDLKKFQGLMVLLDNMKVE